VRSRVAALALLVLAQAYPIAAIDGGAAPLGWRDAAWPLASALLLVAAALRALWPTETLRATLPLSRWRSLAPPASASAAGIGEAPAAAGFWLALLALGLLAVITVQRTAALDGQRAFGLFTAALFGAWVLLFWQIGVTAFDVRGCCCPRRASSCGRSPITPARSPAISRRRS